MIRNNRKVSINSLRKPCAVHLRTEDGWEVSARYCNDFYP
ncbi:unnamed protein product [Haemonchus placei]|uniref:Uncharacterized protein n=1 Tax=Haemonchus placei TaxID=6290 RepID=A0A3P7WAT2_HAEPC|nr:unnamed protein product [Haemonchus placei]